MTEQTEFQRDAIVAWLEEKDNFQRATALSGLSGSKHYQGDADRCQAEQIEEQALKDLAAAVNAALPRSMWDSKHAKQMLQRYLTLFRATATQASQPGFSLSRTDKVFGIKVIEDKLNSMCPHYMRLQSLYKGTMGEAWQDYVIRNRGGKGTKDKESVQVHTTDALEQTKVDAADQKSRQRGVPKSSDDATRDVLAKDKSAGDKVVGIDCNIRTNLTKQRGKGKVKNVLGNKKKSSLKDMVVQKNDQHPGDSARFDHQEKQTTSYRDDKTPEIIELASEGEDDSSMSANASFVNVGFQSRAFKPVSSDNDPKKRKLRCKIALQKPERETSQASEAGIKHSTTAASNFLLTRKGTSFGSSLEPAETRSGNEAPVNNKPTGVVMQHSSEVSNEMQRLTPSQKNAASATRSGVAQVSKVGTETPIQYKSNSPVQPRFQTPDTLRSAIAQVVSQRQQLLDKQRDRRQIWPRDVRSSPYDQGFEKETNASNHSSHRSRQDMSAATDRIPTTQVQYGKSSTESSPVTSKDTWNAHPRVETGYTPPLLTKPRSVNKDINLERKRAFLRAKQLAFEQFRWVREHELHELEVKLLRREMKTRESLAQMEMKLQRMYIRADIIQRMVLAGAGVEKIADRLKHL